MSSGIWFWTWAVSAQWRHLDIIFDLIWLLGRLHFQHFVTLHNFSVQALSSLNRRFSWQWGWMLACFSYNIQLADAFWHNLAWWSEYWADWLQRTAECAPCEQVCRFWPEMFLKNVKICAVSYGSVQDSFLCVPLLTFAPKKINLFRGVSRGPLQGLIS